MATPEEQLRNVQQIQQVLEDGFRSLTSSIQNVAEEIGDATDNLITFNTITKDITSHRYLDWFITNWFKVFFINWKIMFPFCNLFTGVCCKIVPQIH